VGCRAGLDAEARRKILCPCRGPRGIHPSSRSFNRSPGHYPSVRSASLSVAELPAARRRVEAVGLITGPWAELPFACAGRGADPAPDNGPGAGRLVAGSMEPSESDESNSLALRLPAVARGAFWETEVSPPGRAGWAPTGLASGSYARPFSLGGILGLSPPRLHYYIPLQLSQDSRGQLA
jgi:hypothetical protein